MPTSEERELTLIGFYGISGAVLNMTAWVHDQYLKSVHTITVKNLNLYSCRLLTLNDAATDKSDSL